MWRWIVSLWVVAGATSYIARHLVLTIPTWTDMHRTVGEFLAAASLGWLVLSYIAHRQVGKKTRWGLIGLPFILYWDILCLMGHFTATFQ